MLVGSSSANIDFHGCEDFAVSERNTGRPAAEKNLVDVVMKDPPEVFQVITCQRDRDMFGYGIANRIRVSETLAFYNLNILRTRRSVGPAHGQFQDGLLYCYL
jgi:hypothetical protein